MTPSDSLGADNAAQPWVFNVAVTIWGASFLAAAAALLLDGPGGLRGWLGPVLIGLTGLAQIFDGFPFPAECRPTSEPWCEARELAGDVGWRHAAHGWTYFLGAISLQLSVFAMAWRFRGDRDWGRFALPTFAAGLLAIAIVAGLFFVAADGGDGSYGLVQRLALAAGGFWIAALAVGLLTLRGPARRRAGPADRSDDAYAASSSSSRS